MIQKFDPRDMSGIPPAQALGHAKEFSPIVHFEPKNLNRTL